MGETRRNKKMTMAICGIAAVALLAGSFAYWNQTHTVENPFNTGEKYATTVIENFNPSDGENWQPGVEVDKAVQVANTGDQDVIIRIKMDEKWVRDNVTYKELKAETDKDKVYLASQDSAIDGLTTNDDTVVAKNLSTSTNWIKGNDGWYYYKVTLSEGQTTDQWLKSVELLNDADMGVQEVKKYITADTTVDASTTWEEYTGKMPNKTTGGELVLHNKTDLVYKQVAGEELLGYVDSNYTLSITTQTVQATKEAVIATFGLTAEQITALGVNWTYAD